MVPPSAYTFKDTCITSRFLGPKDLDGHLATGQLLVNHVILVEIAGVLNGLLCAHCATGYLLLGLISSLVFRAIRDGLPHDPASQERILGAAFTALAAADVSFVLRLTLHILINITGHSVSLMSHSHMRQPTKPSIIATFIGLPTEMRYNFLAWNPMTHGNITFVIVLCSVRYVEFFQ